MATQSIGIDSYVPERTLKQATISLTTTPKNLGGDDGSTVTSHAGFDLWSASAWYIGDADGQARLVAANEAFSLPSSSLFGSWAKSSSGTISLIVTASNKRTT